MEALVAACLPFPAVIFVSGPEGFEESLRGAGYEGRLVGSERCPEALTVNLSALGAARNARAAKAAFSRLFVLSPTAIIEVPESRGGLCSGAFASLDYTASPPIYFDRRGHRGRLLIVSW